MTKKAMLALLFIGLINSSLSAKTAEEILKQNNCMSCHNIRGMKSAPPFSMIIKMNKGWFGVPENDIKNSIKNGSQGKYPMFFNSNMPAFKNLTDAELDTLMSWIKAQSSKGMRNNMMHHKK